MCYSVLKAEHERVVGILNVVANGFVVKTDIHTLFDARYSRMSEDGIVGLSSKIRVDYGSSILSQIAVPDFSNRDFYIGDGMTTTECDCFRWKYSNKNNDMLLMLQIQCFLPIHVHN